MKDWQAMSPRERDALVAETVMGLCSHDFQLSDPPHWRCAKCGIGSYFMKMLADLHYTTSIEAAFQVVAKLREEGIEMTLHNAQFGRSMSGGLTGQEWACVFTLEDGRQFWADADTAPEAICRAALRVRRAQTRTEARP